MHQLLVYASCVLPTGPLNASQIALELCPSNQTWLAGLGCWNDAVETLSRMSQDDGMRMREGPADSMKVNKTARMFSSQKHHHDIIGKAKSSFIAAGSTPMQAAEVLAKYPDWMCHQTALLMRL